MDKRLFCWHCEERIIGKLVPLERFPRCGQCPSWDAGCDDPLCSICLSEAEVRTRLVRKTKSQRTNKDRRATA